MIEIYWGDGKGKTTAAAGLALRAAGHGIPVLFFQFMKGGTSGEITMLSALPDVRVHFPRPFYGFFHTMNEEQKEEMRRQYQDFLERAAQEMEKQKKASEEAGKEKEISLVLVLDEVIHACSRKLVREEELFKLLEACPACVELVLTGRSPSAELLAKADYSSEIKKHRHPYDRGVPARKGIEV